MELTKLKIVLLKSIKKNGNQPLTLQHLVNIIDVIEKEDEIIEERERKAMDESWGECNNPNQ